MDPAGDVPHRVRHAAPPPGVVLPRPADGLPVGRALWWGLADASTPSTLDDLLVEPAEQDRVAVAVGLLRAGEATLGRLPEWIVDVAVDWHEDPAAVAAVAWRAEAARAVGLDRATERVSVAWDLATSAPPAPVPAGIRFRGGADAEFLDLFARVAVGSLDAHTRGAVAELGARGAAADDLAFYRSLPGRREDWRVAEGPHGVVLGFVLATRTAYDAAVSFIGVLPQHRGRRVVDALLAEALRVHTAAGATRVVGTTDAANTPMRRAFERAGFRVTKRRMVFER